MKVHLRDARTRQYFHDAGEWTPDVLEAFDFKHTYAAMAAAGTLGLPALEIVLAFDDPLYDIAVPVGRKPDEPRKRI
jgi:hypothetical protein